MTCKMDDVGRNLDKFLRQMKELLPLLENESEHIRELRTKADSEISRLKKENDELQRELQTFVEKQNRQGRTTEEDKNASIMKNKYERTTMQVELLNRKYEEKKAENKKLKKDIEELLAEKLNVEKTCDAHNFKIKNLEQAVQNTETQKEAMTQQHERKHKHLRDKLEETEKELQETKLRLSKYMGHQLADSNPNIADLSDQNRPTKIGEMFASLYDDEYTNAFEEIDVEYKHKSNEEICETLLELLMESKKFCDGKAEEQLRALKRECLVQDSTSFSADASLIEYSLKEMKDIRKNNAKKSMKSVLEKFTHYMTHTKQASIFLCPRRFAKTIEYVRVCVEICWLMAVQDPPMVFGPLPRRYDRVDANLYKLYTKSGRKVDFVVWPVLYLHEKGPVLCKGVLEPIKQAKHDNQYIELRENNIEGRYEGSRLDQYSKRTLVSPSDIQLSSTKTDDLYFSSSRDTLLNSERTRKDIASERSSHLRAERATPSYQQETFLTNYNRSPWSYTHSYDLNITRSDRLRTRGKKY